MSHSNFIMVFYIFFVSMAILIFIQIDQVTYSKDLNTEYGSKLTSATQAAVATMDASKTKNGNTLWSDRAGRKKTIDTFYHTLSMSFDNTLIDNKIQISTPVVLFVDTDGFYIGYNALFKLENIADATKRNSFIDNLQVTELIPWSIDKNGYSIRFYLNDNISVIAPDGKMYKGSRRDVAKNLLKDADPANQHEQISEYLEKRTDKTSNGEVISSEYDYDLNLAVVGSVQQTLNDYINKYNKSYIVDSEAYKLEMPQVSGEMWHRLLENPTFIAFMQGGNTLTGKNVLNTFAYAGGEYIKGSKYFVTDDGYYHEYDKAVEAGEMYYDAAIKAYVFRGHNGVGINETIVMLYNDSRECAKMGASPCPDCVQ